MSDNDTTAAAGPIEYEVTARVQTTTTETWKIVSPVPLDTDDLEDIVLHGSRPEGVTLETITSDEEEYSAQLTAAENVTTGETLID